MQRLDLQIKEQQTLQLTLAMRQSMQILELPIVELAEWLHNELALNPALEPIKPKKCTREKLVVETAVVPSRFQVLMEQVRIELDVNELEIAEWIIGNLDEKGFFSLPASDDQLVVLQKIQQIYASGIAARDTTECLLIQLAAKNKEFAYRLVQEHLEDLLQNRLQKVAKRMGCHLRFLKEIVKRDILSLNFCPSLAFSKEKVPLLIPDIIVAKQEDHWLIAVSEEGLPEITFSSGYLLEMKSSLQQRSHFLANIQVGKQLIQALEKRKATLQKIARVLVTKMTDFFEGTIPYPPPLTIREVATELSLHESTVARAVNGKCIQCMQGVFLIRKFFTPTLIQEDGRAISNQQAKQLLKELIERENKQAPSSDEALMEEMKKNGIICARRTITKYRKQLKIPSAFQRRKWRESGANEESGLF